MAGGGRSNYTWKEDEFLVKYIAKYNPQPTGRLGNKLYMTLVENAGKKWNWSRAHPWQSWRERYRKNQEEFDRKITRYMQEKADAALEKEFPSQTVETKAKPTKVRREIDNTDQKPMISSPNRLLNKGKSKQVASHEHTMPEEGSSRQPQSAEVKKKRSEAGHDDTRRIAPKSSKPSKDIDEEAPTQQLRPLIEDINEQPNIANAEPSTSTTSKVVEPISAPVDETESVGQTLEDELMDELFGSYAEEEENVDELAPYSQADSENLEHNYAVQSIYPELPTSELKDEPHVPGAFKPVAHEPEPPPTRPAPTIRTTHPTPIAPLPNKLKPKLRKPAREDPFETASESSSPPTRPRYGLPVLVDNGFRSTLKRPRRSSDGDENAPLWPPKRAKKNPEVTRAKDVERMDVDTVAPVGTRKTETNQIKHTVPTRRPVHVNAIASSSKTKLPPAAIVDHQPDSLILPNASKATAIEISSNTVAHKVLPTKTTAAEMRAYDTSAKPALPISHTSTHALPVGALSDNDPFTAKTIPTKDKGKARADFIINNNQPLRIDLHKQSLQRRLTNTTLPRSATNSGYSSHASSSSGTRRKRKSGGSDSLRKSLIGIGPADPKFEFVVAAVEDISQTLAQMASAYGVVEHIAQVTYMRTKSLEKTRFMLQQLRDAMAEKERAIYAAMPELTFKSGEDAEADADDSDEEVPGGLVIRSRSKTKELEQEGHGKYSKSPIRSGGRPSLSIRRIPDEEEDHTLSEYEPPSKSHASKFARLMKQGRVDEAVEREKRRISGLFIPNTQNPRQSLPLSTAASPTPLPQSRNALAVEVDEDEVIVDNVGNGAEIAPEDDEDDIYVRDDEMDREADDESDHEEEEARGLSPPYPTIEALIKRLSGGHNEAPEFLATAQRHRELVFGAEVQNEEELRQFEEEHSPSMLRLWSVKWAKEMLSGFPKTNATENQATDA